MYFGVQLPGARHNRRFIVSARQGTILENLLLSLFLNHQHHGQDAALSRRPSLARQLMRLSSSQSTPLINIDNVSISISRPRILAWLPGDAFPCYISNVSPGGHHSPQGSARGNFKNKHSILRHPNCKCALYSVGRRVQGVV
jgi:hypothetical protein